MYHEDKKVLILILMECLLRQQLDIYVARTQVLILILMECLLRPVKMRFGQKMQKS